MIVHAAESLYWFTTIEPPYLIKELPISVDSRYTTGAERVLKRIRRRFCLRGTRAEQALLLKKKTASHYEHRACFHRRGLPCRLLSARTKIATRNVICPLAVA